MNLQYQLLKFPQNMRPNDQRHSYFSSTFAFCPFPTCFSSSKVWAPLDQISGCIVSLTVHLSCNLGRFCTVLTNNLCPTIVSSTASFIWGGANSCRASNFSLGSCFCRQQFLKMSLNGRRAPLLLVAFARFCVLHLGLWLLLSWINLDYFCKLLIFLHGWYYKFSRPHNMLTLYYIKRFPQT